MYTTITLNMNSYTFLYIYVYIYRERERERNVQRHQGLKANGTKAECLHLILEG